MTREEQLRSLLVARGANNVPHGGRTLLDHLHGTRRLLENWGAPETWSLMGMLHSVYGTDRFRTQLLQGDADRAVVRAAAGLEVEELAWLFGTVSRELILTEPPTWSYGDGGSRNESALAALRNVHVANAIEQLAAAHARPEPGHWARYPHRLLLDAAEQALARLADGATPAEVVSDAARRPAAVPVRAAIR